MNLWSRNGTANRNGKTEDNSKLITMINERLGHANAKMRIVGIANVLAETKGIKPKYPPTEAFVSLIRLLKSETEVNVVVKTVEAIAEIIPRIKNEETAAREMQILLSEKNEKNARLFVQIIATGDGGHDKISCAAVRFLSNYSREELQKAGINNVRGIFLEAITNEKLQMDTKLSALGALDFACKGKLLEETELSEIESKLHMLAVDMKTPPRLKEVVIKRFAERTERPKLEVVENAEVIPFNPNEQTIEISTRNDMPAVTQDIDPMYLFIEGLKNDSEKSRFNAARALVVVAAQQKSREKVEKIEKELAKRGSEFGDQLREVKKILEKMPLKDPSMRDRPTMPPFAVKPGKPPKRDTTYGLGKNAPKRRR